MHIQITQKILIFNPNDSSYLKFVKINDWYISVDLRLKVNKINVLNFGSNSASNKYKIDSILINSKRIRHNN